MSTLPKKSFTRYHGWLPASPVVHKSFYDRHNRLIRAPLSSRAAHTPAVAKFAAAIKADATMTDLFNQIFLQVSKENHIKDFGSLLYMMDAIIVAPPSFEEATDPETGEVIGEPIGVPLYLLFDLLSNTSAAYDLFRMPAFNDALKPLLNTWGQYLMTNDSNKTLTDGPGGWFSSVALQSLEDGRGDFDSTYITPNPTAVNRGYQSWDAFFTREVQLAARPIDFAHDKSLIHSACESTVYRIARNVQLHDRFWLKNQDYSLYDMLARHEISKKFVGGTVYQAFLSPQDYHRWRSPVDGTIVDACVVPGTYYAVLPDAGAPADDPDLKPGDPHGALIRSQSWITQSSARALIYIKADNEKIGTVGFIGVGMAEVSTCEIVVKKDQVVKTGDELGMFHFGGSSHTLIFGPQAKITFADTVQLDQHLLVNSVIAQVV